MGEAKAAVAAVQKFKIHVYANAWKLRPPNLNFGTLEP